MFWMRNEENSFTIHTLIWRPVLVCKISHELVGALDAIGKDVTWGHIEELS